MIARSLLKPYSAFSSMVAVLGNWARDRFDDCATYEIERMARDVGLSSNELYRMSKLKPDAAKLLLDRMSALHLNPETFAKVHPSTMRDLQRLCSNCTSKMRCRRDLVHRRDNPVWRKYCPNEATLDALKAEALNARCG